MKRLLLVALAVGFLINDASRAPLSAQAPPSLGLDSLFSLSDGVVRDTNGDGLADAIAARVIVSDTPSLEDMIVATNLAGRLGFETTAMTLPIVLRASDPAAANVPLGIFVGRSNPRVAAFVTQGYGDTKGLEKGQGALAMVPGGVMITGADDAGTLAAGNVLAAYLPRLWGASGARLDHAQDEVVKYLAAHGVRATSAVVRSMLIDSDKRGLKSMNVRVSVAALDVPRAKAAFDALDAAHRRGLEPNVLNFANVASTTLEVGDAVRVSVRRSGLNTRALTPPDDEATAAAAAAAAAAATAGAGAGPGAAANAGGGPSPAAAAAGGGGGSTFDLSTIFSIDGVLGDSYPDLIADRVDTTMFLGASPDNLSAAHIAARLGLESTGMALPIARKADEVPDLSRETNPILIGRDNPHVAATCRSS